MLLNICDLVLEGLLLSTEAGDVKLASFLDAQRMCRLYEKFILEYYRYHHSELNPNPDKVDWDTDASKLDLLPAIAQRHHLRQQAGAGLRGHRAAAGGGCRRASDPGSGNSACPHPGRGHRRGEHPDGGD